MVLLEHMAYNAHGYKKPFGKVSKERIKAAINKAFDYVEKGQPVSAAVLEFANECKKHKRNTPFVP